jgi:hypothetical protein
MPADMDTANPVKNDQHQYSRVNFLDLDIQIVISQGSAAFAYKVYRKPGSAYAYLPYGSYHARHVFRGWLKAELLRLLTHSSSPSIWLEECSIFRSTCATEATLSKPLTPASAKSTGTSGKLCWNPRSGALTTMPFSLITADAYSPTEMRLELMSYEGT